MYARISYGDEVRKITSYNFISTSAYIVATITVPGMLGNWNLNRHSHGSFSIHIWSRRERTVKVVGCSMFPASSDLDLQLQQQLRCKHSQIKYLNLTVASSRMAQHYLLQLNDALSWLQNLTNLNWDTS